MRANPRMHQTRDRKWSFIFIRKCTYRNKTTDFSLIPFLGPFSVSPLPEASATALKSDFPRSFLDFNIKVYINYSTATAQTRAVLLSTVVVVLDLVSVAFGE